MVARMKTFWLMLLVAFDSMLMIFSAHAEPLAVGAEAPKVTGTTEAGEPLDLEKVYAQQPYTLIYFYPRADTPGCTKQGCSLRDSYEKLTAKGIAVIGVSTDAAGAQEKFKAKYKLPFTLLADSEKKVIEAFGVPAKKSASRQAYLIRNGKIVWVDHSASTEKQASDVLAAVQELEKK